MKSLSRTAFIVLAAFVLSVAFTAQQRAYAQAGTATLDGILVISEFRFDGPGGASAGPQVSNDEYVEICNPTTGNVVVNSSDASGGWGLYARGRFAPTATLVFTILNGTTIPAGRCFLGAGAGYSLNNTGAPLFTFQGTAPDAAYGGDIEVDSGIALFTSNNVNFTTTTWGSNTTPAATVFRLDAVGFTSGGAPFPDPANAGVFREGTPLPGIGDQTRPQYAFVRKNRSLAAQDQKQDTNDNLTDFYGGRPVAVTNRAGGLLGGLSGTDCTGNNAFSGAATTVCIMLGAPGPEGSGVGDPTNRRFSEFTGTSFDAGAGATAFPNRERNGQTRDFEREPQGTFAIRFTYTNNTGGPVTRLRFRIVDLTSPNRGSSPELAAGGTTEAQQAMLRATYSNSSNQFVSQGADINCFSTGASAAQQTAGNNTPCGGAGQKFVNGTTLENLNRNAPPTTDNPGEVNEVTTTGFADGPFTDNGGGINSAFVVNIDAQQATFPANTNGPASSQNQRSLGGLATNIGVGVGLGGPIPAGARASFEFRFGVVRSGRFILVLIPEAN